MYSDITADVINARKDLNVAIASGILTIIQKASSEIIISSVRRIMIYAKT
jgi:hypothetical protein